MIFGFIETHHQEWPVTVMCHILQVSTAGYTPGGFGPSASASNDAAVERRDSGDSRHGQGPLRPSPFVHAELTARAARAVSTPWRS